MEIVGYVASEERFFVTPCCINCSVEEYCAFPDADRVFGVDRVHEKNLVDVGDGILISEPVIVERRLRVERSGFFASLSHQGILAIFSWNKKPNIQFTNFINGKQVEVGVEDTSIVAFYDDKMILLTYSRPLREAAVEEVLDKKNISFFKSIGDVDEVSLYTDTSLLHSRRILCYISTQFIPYEYNVDTRENKRMGIEQEVLVFPSLMGIDCGMKTIFQDADDYSTYALDWDNKVTPLYGANEEEDLKSLFISSSNPRDFYKGASRYNSHFIKGGKRIDLKKPISFESKQSVIRVYRDIFLLLDMNTRKWVLSRVTIP